MEVSAAEDHVYTKGLVYFSFFSPLTYKDLHLFNERINSQSNFGEVTTVNYYFSSFISNFVRFIKIKFSQTSLTSLATFSFPLKWNISVFLSFLITIPLFTSSNNFRSRIFSFPFVTFARKLLGSFLHEVLQGILFECNMCNDKFVSLFESGPGLNTKRYKRSAYTFETFLPLYLPFSLCNKHFTQSQDTRTKSYNYKSRQRFSVRLHWNYFVLTLSQRPRHTWLYAVQRFD